MDCLIFLNLFTLLFFDVILIQRGHAAQTVYDRFNLLYNEINVLFCDLLIYGIYISGKMEGPAAGPHL